MFCKYCGNSLNLDDKFCKNCGAKVEVIEQKKEESKTVESSFNVNTQNTQTQVKVEKLKGLKIASLVLGIISLVFFILNILMLPLEIVGIVLAIVYMVKNKKFCAGIVLNIIAILLSIFIFVLGIAAISTYTGVNMEETLNNLDKQIEKFEKLELYSKKSDKYEIGYKYVGSEEYGYIKVPSNWVKFVDVEKNDTIQYSYANTWIATIYATKSDLSLGKYANKIYSNFKEDGANFVTLRKEKIAEEYNAYKVTCYYEDENVYVRCWAFEDEKNVIHYIAIEGPEKENDYYDLINTFVLKK